MLNQATHRYRIATIKRQCIRAIRKIVEPHFYKSGYTTDLKPKKGGGISSRPFMLVALVKPMKFGKTFAASWARDKDMEIITFNEGGGFSCDAAGGGIVDIALAALPLEDLITLRSKVARMNPANFHTPRKLKK